MRKRAAGFRRTSNAGKPSGFRSKAATVRRASLSGKPRRRIRHHRTRQPLAGSSPRPSRRAVRLQGRLTPLETRARIPANVSERRNAAPPVSDSGDRSRRVRPVSGSEVPASRAAGFRHHRTPPPSRATYPATVRQSQCLITETETETESRRPRVCGRGRVCAFRLRLVILYSFFFFLWIAHAMLMQCLCIAYAYRAAPDSARAVRALAATIAGNAA